MILRHAYETLAHGTDSALGLGKDETRTMGLFRHDAEALDGEVSYRLETVGYTREKGSIGLIEVDTGGQVAVAISDGAKPNRREVSHRFTGLASGVYAPRISGTKLGQANVSYALRLLIEQRNPTRTRLQVPLVGAFNDAHGNTQGPVLYVGGNDWSEPRQDYVPWFCFDTARYPGALGRFRAPVFELEIVAEGNVDVAVRHLEGNKVIEESVIEARGEGPSLHSRRFSWLPDGIFGLVAKSGGVPGGRIYDARLYVTCDPSLGCEVHRRISRMANKNTSVTLPALIEPEGAASMRCEVTACGGSGTIRVRRDGAVVGEITVLSPDKNLLSVELPLERGEYTVQLVEPELVIADARIVTTYAAQGGGDDGEVLARLAAVEAEVAAIRRIVEGG